MAPATPQVSDLVVYRDRRGPVFGRVRGVVMSDADRGVHQVLDSWMRRVTVTLDAIESTADRPVWYAEDWLAPLPAAEPEPLLFAA